MIFFNDVNAGIWITKLAGPRATGAATEPGV
jgi:hypothetical protein